MENRLRYLRRISGITQQELSDATGIAHSVICFIEQGKRAFRQVHIDKFCAVLGATSDFLLNKSDIGILVFTKSSEEPIALSETSFEQMQDKVYTRKLHNSKPVNVNILANGEVKETAFVPSMLIHREFIGEYQSDTKDSYIQKINILLNDMDVRSLDKVVSLIEMFLNK